MTIIPPFQSAEMKVHFDSYPNDAREALLQLRRLIFQVANEIPDIGELQETLKWGEPSYMPVKPKIGTTIRIDWKSKRPDQYFVFVNCKTTLIEDIKAVYGNELVTEGQRSLVFDIGYPINTNHLLDCFHMAFTYHLNKKQAL